VCLEYLHGRHSTCQSINSFKRAKVLVHHQASSQILDCIQVLMSAVYAKRSLKLIAKSKITRQTGEVVGGGSYHAEHVLCCQKFPLIKTNHIWMNYEARTLLRLGVSLCRTRIGVWHRHDTNTYNYTELCHFIKLLLVSACPRPCSVWCPCLRFIDTLKANMLIVI